MIFHLDTNFSKMLDNALNQMPELLGVQIPDHSLSILQLLMRHSFPTFT